MEKPKRRKENILKGTSLFTNEKIILDSTVYNNGYNQCIDEYEKFLPGEKELLKIIKDTSTLVKNIDGIFRKIYIFEPEKTAKEIYKIIGGEE